MKGHLGSAYFSLIDRIFSSNRSKYLPNDSNSEVLSANNNVCHDSLDFVNNVSLSGSQSWTHLKEKCNVWECFSLYSLVWIKSWQFMIQLQEGQLIYDIKFLAFKTDGFIFMEAPSGPKFQAFTSFFFCNSSIHTTFSRNTQVLN